MKASHKKRIASVGFQEIELQPGQFVTGAKVAAKETGLSPQQLRTCKLRLVEYGKLTVKTTNKFSIITVVNWDTYQRDRRRSDSQEVSQEVTQATNKMLVEGEKTTVKITPKHSAKADINSDAYQKDRRRSNSQDDTQATNKLPKSNNRQQCKQLNNLYNKNKNDGQQPTPEQWAAVIKKIKRNRIY